MEVYKVIEGQNINDFCRTVNELMNYGYALAGGLQVVTTCTTDERKGYEECATTYYQALALKTE